jgi:riboflavin biosynthesis pyrimidine reductase
MTKPLTFQRLLPPGTPATVQEVVTSLELGDRSMRKSTGSCPYLLLNMVSTTDGRASIHGRSGPIGNRADTELFHALRTAIDGVMIGAQTLRTERYNRIVDDPVQRKLRLEHGLAEEPFACVLSQSLDLPGDLPLLADPSARVVILTPSQMSLSDCAAEVHYIRSEPGTTLDLSAAMVELRRRFEIGTLLCEGGPHLNGQLFAAGLVDELLLTFAPMLAGESPNEQIVRITAGVDLEPPIELELRTVFESESHLFLRYSII